MKSKILLITIFFSVSICTYAQYIPIDSARQLDTGTIVTVRGVVTTSGELGNTLVYFQDPTAGLVAYDSPFNTGTNNGDSVQVTGKLTQYAGLLELQPVNTFSILATNITVTPEIVTPSGIRINGEDYEGELIRINNITAVKNFSGNPVTHWNVSGSGTNYRIFSGSDSCDIRIYATTNIANSPVPPFPFSVIAVSSQYDASPPHNTGYQIIPRSLSDFITTSTGPLLSQITYSNILQSSVTITWASSAPADSKVRWMLSDSNYQVINYTDSMYNATLTTSHSFTLTGLQSGRIYNFNVTSSNTNGNTTSSNQMFITQSASSGAINVYFNKSVDTTLNTGELALGNVNFQTKLLQRINAAQFSIDMCLYSLSELTQIRDALINAKLRGVKIRFVYDSRTNQQLVNELITAGIPIQKRNYDTSNIMHNKFFIFDYRNTSSAADDWVWTGSTNVTEDQFFTDNNNVIEIQDQSLAAIYTREFEEMWGSATDSPIPSRAKFGGLKTDNVPHVLNINGSRVEVYFSPSDNTSTQIENLISTQTDYDIFFEAFAFTRYNISNRMKSKFDQGKNVRGVFDSGNLTDPNSVYKEMKGIGGQYPWNPPADVWLDTETGLMHSKYILIDAPYSSSNPVVETGSYNYSNAATFYNDENYLFVFNPRVANLYLQEFYKRYRVSGGQAIITIGIEQISTESPEEFRLFQNYPNPFNPSTKIRFSIPLSSGVSEGRGVLLKIYDILGREVATLVNDKLKPGTYEVEWNGTNFPSGIYFYRIAIHSDKLIAGDFAQTKKMILIK